MAGTDGMLVCGLEILCARWTVDGRRWTVDSPDGAFTVLCAAEISMNSKRGIISRRCYVCTVAK